MKNLAICFSGAIRSFHLCQDSIKKMIIDPLREEYNVYIFGHFWTIKQEENLEDLAYRMKWKKESECVYDLLKNFGFTQYIIEEYNSKREQEIMDNLGLLNEGKLRQEALQISHNDLVNNKLDKNCNPDNSTEIKSELLKVTQNNNQPFKTVSMARQAKAKDIQNPAQTGVMNKVAPVCHMSPVSSLSMEIQTLARKILDNYKLIEDDEKKTQYLNYAVNCMGMYYKILMSNNLKNEWAKANNVQFDYAIRMRPDFLWNEKIPVGIFEEINDQNIVLVYDNYCTRAKWQGNDKFFGGTNTMMNTYCDLYNQFEYFFDKGIRIEGQELAQAMVKKMDLKIVFFGSENTYDKVAGPLHRRLEKEWAKEQARARKTKKPGN